MFFAPAPVTRRLSGQFTLIIDGLCEAVAARAPQALAAGPLLVLLWGRLRRLARRFARLVEQAAAGTRPLPRPRAAGVARKPPAEGAKPRQRWPNGTAWLVRLVPEATSFGSQLQHLLSQPEMAALMASAPQVRRMLAPLGRMLAIGANPKPRPLAKPCAVVASPAPRRPLAAELVGKIVPEWARYAWPGHDFAGLDPPARGPPRPVKPDIQAGAVARPLR